jgi:hypothetical protein
MPVQSLLTIASLITASGIIIAALISIFRLARKISDAIGADKNGRTISERLERVEHQLWENGGSSLADRVNIISEHTIKTMAEVKTIKDFIISNKVDTESIEIAEPVLRKTRSTKKAS